MADKATILYIEDDPGSQVLVQRALAFSGYKVIVASRGLEGIDFAVKHRPDLILMDINLPDLSGREVTTRLRANQLFRTLPIVALTAQSQIGEREKALAAGLTGYLTKPVDIDALPRQIEQYLGGAKDTADQETLLQAHAAYNQEVVERLEAKIRQIESHYEELKRMDKIKDDFIQLTAHELRTPLTVVIGYSRLLQDMQAITQLRRSDQELDAVMYGMMESINRMESVINEIVTISRIATGRVQLALGPTNLSDLMLRIVQSYAEVTKQRKLMIGFNPTQWPTSIHSDSNLLELALNNVIGNAIKYTPDGGAVNLFSKVGANTVLITIQDTGIGIDSADQQRIFDRFYTVGDHMLHSTSKTAFRGGGLGLGLSICRGIVEAHGGKIWVESPGRDETNLPGSTFYIDLPLQARTTSPRRVIAGSGASTGD